MKNRIREILFIVPPCHMDFNIDFEVAFPNHILYLINYAEKAGWKASFLDMTIEEKEGKNSFDILDNRIKESNIDLIGISNHTVRTVPTTYETTDFIKKRTNIPIIVGGLNASFMWQIMLHDNPNIDFIIKGFGQEPLYTFLSNFPHIKGKAIPGLISREHKNIIKTEVHPVKGEHFILEELNTIDVNRYLNWTTTYTLNSHFGCNYLCNFCTANMPDKCQRAEVIRSVNDVIREIQIAQKVGFNSFLMNANNFTSSKEWLNSFVTTLQKMNLRIEWSCMSRIEYLDEDTIELLQKAQCKNVAIGIESASSSNWKELNKGNFAATSVIETFKLLKARGIETTTYLIAGAPNQNHKDINLTIDILKELNPDNRIVSFFQPYPGTQYWKNPTKFGLKNIEPFERWNLYEHPICETNIMTKEEILISAIRLYIDTGSGSGINIEKNYLVSSNSINQYDHLMPKEVHYLLSNKNNYNVYELLKQVISKYDTQAFLTCLYWLHYFFKNKITTYV